MTKSIDQPRERLFVKTPLAESKDAILGQGQSHYLRNVMQLGPGDEVTLFNGCDGEWRAKIIDINKRATRLEVVESLADQTVDADLWLLFAPIMKARLNYMIEKAVELGVGRLCPTITERTVVRAINFGRLATHSIATAEQCGRLSVPKLAEMASLSERLEKWPAGRRLIYCDEYGEAATMATWLASLTENDRAGPWAIVIGPEGGFSPGEREVLRGQEYVHPVSLGPLVLRSDTAAVTAISLWQGLIGDWASENPSR